MFAATLLLFAAAGSAQTPVAVSPFEMSDAEFDALVAKTNLYVKALNSVATVRRSYDRYSSWVDVKKGVTGKERYISYGLYELNRSAVADITRAGQTGPQMRPHLPVLDDTVVELAGAVAALEPLVKKASAYYSHEDYKDDDTRQGRELHLQMMPLFQRTFEAEAALRDGLDAIKVQLDQRQLAEIENTSGRKYQWHLRSFMIAAKGVINLLPDSPHAPVIPAKEYKTRFSELEGAYHAFQSYSSDHPEEVKKALLAGMVDSAVSDFFAASKFLRRTLETQRVDRREYLERVMELAKKYNELIERTNSLR